MLYVIAVILSVIAMLLYQVVGRLDDLLALWRKKL